MEEKTEQATTPETKKPESAQATAEKTPKKKSFARRFLKGLLWTIGGILLFVVIALLTLPLWINPVGTSLANAIVPVYTGTAFKLERINLNIYNGKLLVSGVKLANPEGYAEKEAFSLGSLSAEVEVSSLLSKTIHVVDVTIDSPFASYVFDAGGVNNFDRIIEAVNKKLGPKKKKDEEPSETKVVVDKVTIKNVRVVVANGELGLATLTLTDFGKDTPAKLEIADVKLTNPKGFSAEDAFSLKSLSIGMDTADVSALPFKIHDIVVDTPYASYVFNDQKVDNFTRMLEPLLAKGKSEEKEPKKEANKEKKSDSHASPVTLDKLEIKSLKAQIAGGEFNLDSLVVTDYGKPTAAMIKLDGAKLVNPKGYPEPNAFTLKSLSIGMETADISKKPMVFHDIIVDSTYAGMVYKDGVSNIDAMFKPFMGDDEEKKEDDKKKEVAKADEKKDGEDEEDDSPRVVIDKLDISGTKIQYRLVSVPIPLPTFTDIGKDSKDGASAKEVGNQILEKAQEAMAGVGGLVGMLGADATNVLGNATGFLGASATNLLGSATGLVSGGVSNVLSGATGVIGGATGIVSGGVSNVLSGATGVTNKAAEGVKNLSEKATEGAKDALKKLGTGGGLFGD